ncbi:MAG: hypothetical protein JXQ83_01280 [Candidatus Glassbacteria bacterium]|nr:hypothetical protein [Candidatus Glassbacteria bacterium]
MIFRIRRGTAFTDDAERWRIAHTEENVKKIAQTGERMLYTHFYKGYGFQAEKEEMDLAIRVAGWAKKYGMISGVYVQWGTVVWETFLQEDPRARDWVLYDRDGHPVRIAYGHYYWRYLPDIRNREYMEWYKEKILRYCIENLKPRYIFLDNVAENPPVSWQPLHNRNWIEDFRSYLRTRYMPGELKAMIGYSNVDNILPPYWEWADDLVVNDPVMQRWIDFRCRSVTEAVADVCRFIKQLDPTIAVGVNIHGISRENRAIRGIDPVAVCNGTGVDAWSGEIWVEAELTDDGVLVSPIREYKACRTLGTAFQSGGRSALGRAVKLAFSYRHQIPGGGWLGSPGRASYLNGPAPDDQFYRYVDYYRDTESVADVAVLRSYPSLAYNSFATLAGTVGFEQALIQAKVPFDIIFEENLKDLSKYKVLVLANTESMSDSDLELVRSYVRSGGGLVATGSASLYNEWRRPRPEFGLGDILGLSREEARRTLGAYRISDAVSTYQGAGGIGVKMNSFGRGRAVYIPRVIPAYAGTTVRMNLPANWPELVEAVKWACRDDLSLDLKAPLTVVMNLYRKNDQDQLILHLVNFKQDLLRDIPVELKVPTGRKVKSITLISPDNPETSSVEFTRENGKLHFRVPELRLYDMLVIQLG